MLLANRKSRIQEVLFSEIKDSGVQLYIKREDELHPVVSGNKYRKLIYNIKKAKELHATQLVTFGGAYSNHLVATAAAGKAAGISTIGIVRGEELKNKRAEVYHNPTLSKCMEYGMQLEFVSRQAYREKHTEQALSLYKEKYTNCYIVPEGGTNHLAIKGCEEILSAEDEIFDVICTAVGTGGTISGISNSAKRHQLIMGFPVLKGDFLQKEIQKYTKTTNWELKLSYHFGGYAKVSEELIIFINQFKKETGIPLDPIYTGKMLFGIVDLIKKKAFEKGAKILAIHTGGLQGIEGMNKVLIQKNKEWIH